MKLTLAEELLLLCLKDEKGTVVFSASTGLPYGLAGAVLMELGMRGKIRVNEKKLVVTEYSNTGDLLLDECLGILRQSAKPRTVRHWVSKFANRKAIRKGYLDRLVQKSILKREEHRILWVFPTTHFPMTNPLEEFEVRQRLRQLALTDTIPDQQTLLLASLVQACGLIGEIFAGEEKKRAKKRLAALTKEEIYGKAVAQEITAAIAVCVAAGSAGAAAAAAH